MSKVNLGSACLLGLGLWKQGKGNGMKNLSGDEAWVWE